MTGLSIVRKFNTSGGAENILARKGIKIKKSEEK